MHVFPSEWQLAKSLKSSKAQKIKRNEDLPHSFIHFGSSTLALANSQDEIKYLGEGVSAKVKLAQDEAGVLYAVKIQESKDAHQFEKLKHRSGRESRVAHDVGMVSMDGSILTRYKKSEEVAKTYIFYKYRGISITQYLENSLTEEQKYDVAIKIALSVYKLHSGKSSSAGKKYAHLDIKPDNITIDKDGNIYIIDYGFSTFLNEKNNYRTGSPFYQPANPIGVKFEYLDVFALLRTLYIPTFCFTYHYKSGKIIRDNRTPEDKSIFSEQLAGENPCLYEFLNTSNSRARAVSALQITAILVLAKYSLLSKSSLSRCLKQNLNIVNKIVNLYQDNLDKTHYVKLISSDSNVTCDRKLPLNKNTFFSEESLLKPKKLENKHLKRSFSAP